MKLWLSVRLAAKTQAKIKVSRSSNIKLIMAPPELNFITGNKNKLQEVKAILGDTVDIKSQSLELVEIQGTIEQVSIDKCRRAADAVCKSSNEFTSVLTLRIGWWSRTCRRHMLVLQSPE